MLSNRGGYVRGAHVSVNSKVGVLSAGDQYLDKLNVSLGARYSEHTRAAFVGQGRRFMQVVGVKAEYSREDVLLFVDTMVRAGYKEASIQTIVAGVRALFAANKWAWPLERRDMHLGMAQEDAGGPVMPDADVARLIRASRTVGPPEAQAIALATTYGFRAQEIAAVLTSGANGRLIVVQTAKTGRKREHSVPGILQVPLTFSPYPIGVDGVHKAFQRVMERCVRPPLKGEGWHAIRRALITGLLDNELAEFKLHSWMGWRAPGNKISYRYFRKGGKELDAEVFAKHPFLPYWT